MLRRNIAAASLLLACAGLGAVVNGELTGGDVAVASIDPAAHSRTPAPPTARTPLPTVALAPLASFSEVTERPLFSKTRRPPPLQASQEVVRQSGTLVLEGVILARGQRIALVSHGRPAKLTRVLEGQEIEGWTIALIEANRVELQHGATRQELKLFDKGPKRLERSRQTEE